MADPRERAEANRRITLMIAESLDVDLAQVKEGGFTAEWGGSDANVVITWTGIKTMPLHEWQVILDQIIEEQRR